MSAIMGAAFVAAIGLITVLGWFSTTEALTALVPGYEAMRPPTAAALLLLALAVVVITSRLVTLILGTVIMLPGLASIIGYALGSAVGDDLVITAVMTALSAGTGATPMAPSTALCLVLLGAAVVASRRRNSRLMLGLAFGSLCVSQVAFHGYVYGVSSFHAVAGLTSMAPMTSVSLGVLAVCLHLSRPTDGLVGLLRDRGRAGALLRPAVLFYVVGPFVLGLLSVAGQRQGWFDAPFGAGIVVMSVTILGCGVSWIAATRLRDVDRERDAAAGALKMLNHTLESAVADRTRELAQTAASLEALIHIAPVAIVQLNADGGVVTANEQWSEVSGRSAADCLGDAWTRSVHPDDRERWNSGWTASVQAGSGFAITYRLRTPAGVVKWVQVNTTPLRDADPDGAAAADSGADQARIRGHLASITDVTALRAAEQAESAARARFETAFSSSPLGTAIVNAEGLIVEANRRLLDLLGHTDPIADPVIGMPIESVFLSDDPGEPELARAAAYTALLRGAEHHNLPDRRMRRPDSTQVWVRVSMAAIEDGNQKPGLLYQLEDITSRRAAEARVEHLALHDPLTDLPNRLLLLDRLALELNHAQRDGYGVGVLFLDLDRFKAVNDDHGHHAGDAVLQVIAERLLGSARTSDTVARLGGDEFVVVCPNINAGTDLVVISHKIRAAVIEPIRFGATTMSVGVSIGVAYGVGPEKPEALLRRADQDMYRVKQADGTIPA